jgi:hypothetical protein
MGIGIGALCAGRGCMKCVSDRWPEKATDHESVRRSGIWQTDRRQSIVAWRKLAVLSCRRGRRCGNNQAGKCGHVQDAIHPTHTSTTCDEARSQEMPSRPDAIRAAIVVWGYRLGVARLSIFSQA